MGNLYTFYYSTPEENLNNAFRSRLMTTPIKKIYPSAPKENRNYDLEQKLEKKMLDCETTLALRINDLTNFSNSFNNKKKMITHFKDENKKSKEKYKK